MTPKTLAKRLHERGFLRSTEQTHGELQVRRTLEGRRRRVLHLAAGAITLEESGQADPQDTDGAKARAVSHVNGRIAWPDSNDAGLESGQVIRPDNADSAESGRDGRIGRVFDAQEEPRSDNALQGSAPAIDAATEVVEWSA